MVSQLKRSNAGLQRLEPPNLGMILVSTKYSSISTTISNALGYPLDTYLAGLWRSQLLYDLTWRVEHLDLDINNQDRDDTNRSYVAPSWSWASVEGTILFDNKCYQDRWARHDPSIDCLIDDAYCEHVLPDDPTGHVAAAHAMLTGPVVSVELAALSDTLVRTEKRKDYWKTEDVKPKTFVRSVGLHPVEVSLDRPLVPILYQGDYQAKCWQEGKCIFGCCERQQKSPETDLKCLQLFSCNVTPEKNTSYRHHEIWFLLLKKLPQQAGKFERIGVGRCRRERGDAVLFDEAENATVIIV